MVFPLREPAAAERKDTISTGQALTPKVKAETFFWHSGQAVGIAAMILMDGYSNLVFHADKVRMHSGVPLASVAIAFMLDIAILAGLFAACFYGLRKLNAWPIWELAIAAFLIPLLPWHKVLGLSSRYLPESAFQHLPKLDGSPGPLKSILVSCCCALFLLSLRLIAPHRYLTLMKVGGTVLAGFGVFAVIAFGQLFRLIPWQPFPFETGKISAISPKKENAPLLVWIVFDELSHQQTFGKPAPNLKLPYLDAFRAESTLYQQLIPNSNYTETAVPSMFLGESVQQITDGSSNHLLYKTTPNAPWQTLQAERTIFGAAKKANLKVGLVGWYNPYCLMLNGTLATCSCSKAASLSYPLSMQGAWPNAWAILKDLTFSALWPSHAASLRNDALVQELLTTYQDVYARSISLLNGDAYDFVFLHLPVAHPPSIYDRHTGQFVTTFGRSYLDDLALVDRTLGDFLAILKHSPRWRQTSIVVDGDHTWRVNLWREGNVLSEEDKFVSRDGEDPRPALLVHRAGQTEAEAIAEPLRLPKIHDILARLMPAVTLQASN